MPRESGPLWTVLLEGGAVMLGSACREDVGPGEQRGEVTPGDREAGEHLLIPVPPLEKREQ